MKIVVICWLHNVFDKSLSDSHSLICITISCNPTSHDEAVKPSDTVIQHPKYKSKWKPACIDIYTQSFDVNEITTINDEVIFGTWLCITTRN